MNIIEIKMYFVVLRKHFFDENVNVQVIKNGSVIKVFRMLHVQDPVRCH